MEQAQTEPDNLVANRRDLVPAIPDPPVPPMPPLTLPPRPGTVGPLTETGEVFSELVGYALVIIIEGCFMCLWGGVVWAVSHVFDWIEGGIPHNTWAPTLFKYAEIGFAVFILCKLFLRRAHVFEEALIRARRLMRAGRPRPQE
jgi:hypothetical protein